MTEKNKRYQMAFDISREMHTEIKVLAALRNISMNLFMQRALIREIDRQKRNDEQKE